MSPLQRLAMIGALLFFTAVGATAPANQDTATAAELPPDKQPAATAKDDTVRKRLVPQQPLDNLLRPVAAKEPEEALRALKAIPGFRLDLVAHEPDVVDPVAATFDEDGRLYVAEMRDYPFRPKEGEKPTGCVRLLEDTDGDGRFETSHIFADELLWPTGVVPWKQGVFVAAAPNIYYLRDTDGDGRADVRRIVFSGFGTQNEQGSVNNLAYGLDGRIYASTSKNGGQIRPGDDPQAEPVAVSGRDFCFDPATGRFELVTGGGQFGNAFDDWGNRFLCDESDPSMQVMLPHHYLARNPKLAVPTAVNDLTPGVTPIFRASPLEGWRVVRSSRRLALGERSENSSGLSHHVLDGVAGLMIYRGQAFPDSFRGNLIVGDGQNNVIHRRQLVPEGVTFRSQRADPDTEFVQSSDNWFRPVNAINAPDGAVYVTDMAREVIESVHVPWDVAGRIHLTSAGRGRIYRIAPEGFHVPPRPRLSQASTAELVALLAHRGGWWRDTAQRLLRERQVRAAVEPLRAMLRQNDFPLARLHAMYALAQLNALADPDLSVALADRHPGVREHAIRLAEPRFADGSSEVLRAVCAQAADDDPRVRFQVAFSVGEVDSDPERQRAAIDALATVAARDANDPWVRTAILSSSAKFPLELLRTLIARQDTTVRSPQVDDAQLLRQLAALVGRDEHGAPLELLDGLARNEVSAATLPRLGPVLIGLSEGLRTAGTSLQQLKPQLSDPAQRFVTAAVDQATQAVASLPADDPGRNQAILLLSCGELAKVAPTLSALFAPREPEAAQRTAVQALASFDDAEVADVLLRPWRQFTPPLRDAAVQALFAHPQWLESFVAAIERGEVSAGHVGRVHRGMLLALRDPAVRARAEKLFEVDTLARGEVYEQYKPSLALTGQAIDGEKIYERECMACHQIGAKGQAVGPNLALTKHRTKEELLLHILDPNREVQPAFIQYTVIDDSGGVYSGLVAAETATSITLRRDKNVEQTILKNQIEEMSSSDKSLMPEGMEKAITPQQMADLLAFLVDLHYDIGTQPGRRSADEERKP